ncbi:MAG: hypothetical protein ACOC0N_02700 [Chroococcales cyanobacterium]
MPSFKWLTTPNKYFVLIDGGTHSSVLSAINNSIFPAISHLIEPNLEFADSAQSYIKALSLAFFQVHSVNKPEYAAYLETGYATVISENPLNLTVVRSLTTSQNLAFSLDSQPNQIAMQAVQP